MGAGGVGDESAKGKRKRNSAYLQESISEEPKRTRVHAQRKFAQGAGGVSPQVSPIKEIRTRAKTDNGSSSSSSSSGPSFPVQKGERPKTEDFLTFLCLRGTDFLPPELDFFNQASTTQNNDTSDESSSDQDDVDKDPEVDKNGIEKKKSKRLSTNKSKKDNTTPNMKKNKDIELKQKEPKNAIRKTRSHSQDSLSSPERKAEPRQTRSQGEPNKQNNLKQNNNSRKVNENDLKTERESRAVARQHGIGILKSPSHNLESSDESSTDHEGKSGRTSQIQKSESEADADEEASSRESSRRPNSRRSEEGKVRGKDSLSRFKQREGRSTSRDSSGSKESLQAARPIRKPKESGKSHASKIDKKLTPTKEVLSQDLKENEKSPEDCPSDNGETLKDIVPTSVELKEEVNKSPKDKRDTKKVKKHKNKAKTSLKDLQNILLMEAKQKIADTPIAMPSLMQNESSAVNSGASSKRPSTSPADSDTPDTDERISVPQKTGYISVKPRTSIDQLSEEGSVDSGKSPQRRNSGPYAGPNGKKIAKAGERVPTPPRKILPKGDIDPQRSSASPVSGRTNHLPAGVMGAAGLSNRLTQPVAMSKASPMVTSIPSSVIPNLYTNTVAASTYSQPLLIQTSMIPTAMTSSPQVMTQSKPVGTIGSISMHAPTAQPTIIVPGPPNGQQGTLRMPIQMSAVPLQVGMQNVQMGIRPVNGGTQVVTSAMGYQGMTGIPIIGPAGMQFGIPVQSGMHGMPAQVQANPVQMRPQVSQAVVTVPTFIRSGYAYGQPIFAGSVAPVTTTNISSMGQMGMRNASPLQQPTLIQQQNISIPSQLPQPQTITMPSGTTIQYNVPPTSIKQNNLQSKPPVVPSTPPALATSTYVISTNTSPLVSPGPPTLSPQIPGSQRNVTTTSTARQVTKPDVPPVLTPPVRRQEEPKARRELSLIQQSSPAAPAPPPRTHANEPPHVPQPLYSPQAVYSGPPAGYAPQVSPSTYPQHYQHHSPGYHQQQSPGSYHSPQGSITHSPGAYQMGSPVHNPQLTSPIHNPYQHSPYSQGYPVSPVQYNYQTSQQTHTQHTNLQPAHSQPTYTQTSHTQSQPTNAQPIHTQPAHPQTVHPQPAHTQPFHPQTAHQQPTHQQPAHQQPIHQQPTHQQPAHQQPTHQQAHQQHAHQQPTHQHQPHQQPAQQQPARTQTAPIQPSNTQPTITDHSQPSRKSTAPLTSPTESQPIQTQPTPPPLHSPLTHSSSQYHANRKSQNKQQASTHVPEESHPVQLPKEKTKIPVIDAIPSNNVPFQKQKKDENPRESDQTQTPTSTVQSTSVNSSPLNAKKKPGDKMIKSKLGLSKSRPIKTFDVEDESSPYAFDFENPETTPKIPFRKSSSPLKPPSMIKKSTITDPGSSQASVSQTTHADLKPTGSKLNKPQESQKSPAVAKSPKVTAKLDKHKDSISVECDMDTSMEESKNTENPEDGSSSDNETTYFIPLKNSSGQSFGVAVKLGTDGPCGPNQKVIMTAKLVTNPSSKPTKAKILGAKTTESKTSLPVKRPSSPIQSTSTPIKEALTPRKMRMPNASPVSSRRNLISPSSSEDLTQSHHSTPAKPRMRRALSPDSGRSSGSQMKDSSSNSGKKRPMCLLGQVNTGHRFPRLGQHAQMMEAPTFRPTEAEFKDPLRYIQKIRSYAEQFGMCRIIPPKSFKPECNVDDDMRFTAYNQYINRMLSRWGPNAKETAAIKKYLETQNVDTRAHPLVGGLEVDLPALYHAVQSFGGLTEVIQKKKWSKIAEYLRVARGSNITAAGNKLDDIYVKWLLPYDTLSNVEREELLRLVEEEWAEQSREKAERSKVKDGGVSEDEGSDEEEEEEEEDEDQEAVVKGKSTSLTAFYRLARNLMSTIFRNEEPPHHTVEDEYWKIVADKDVHMQVCQGSIDTGLEGYGFPIRNSSFASHSWNLKVLTNNQRSILRAMGRVMGVTQPTLHVGMLFTTGCWYRDPHGLPWIEYLHTGAPKIWYGIPDDHSLAFYTAMKQLVPTFCKNRKIWLPSDTTMVSPSLLVKHGVSVSRAVQQPGQFVVVFPKSYTSSICTGYCVSESVYYAPVDWLADVDSVFKDIKDSQEPMMFPLEKMLFALATDSRATKFVLETIKPKIEKIRDKESELRKQVISLGIKVSERLSLENDSSKEEEDDEYECQVCNANLFVSLIANVDEESTYCLTHGIEYITENKQMVKNCKLLYTHTLEEISMILKKLEERLNNATYIDEPEEDIPLKEDDVVDVEEEDYVDEDDIKQRERAIPSYIKKEKKPLISSESEDNDEEEEQVEDEGPQIGAGDFLEDFPDDVDLPVIEALFGEDDEIVRPSCKRRAPRVRKFTESSEENSDDESEDETTKQEKKAELEKKKKEEAKAKALAKAQEIEMKKKEVEMRKKEIEMRKAQKEKEKKDAMMARAAEKEMLKKRKLDQNAAGGSSKQNQKKKRKESENEMEKKKGKANTEQDSESDTGTSETTSQVSSTSSKKQQFKKEQPKKNITKKEDNLKEKKSVKPTSKLKEPIEKGEKKKDNKKAAPPKTSKEEKAPSRNKKKDAREEKSRQRKSKKRKAKSMDTADQFNLLDIILTETDDENYCSVSEKESEETSSDEEYWK